MRVPIHTVREYLKKVEPQKVDERNPIIRKKKVERGWYIADFTP